MNLHSSHPTSRLRTESWPWRRFRFGLQFLEFLKRLFGVLVPARASVRVAQLEICVIGRMQLHRSFEFTSGPTRIALLQQRFSELVVSIGVIRLLLDHLGQ